jgi:hypothetical protein
MASISVKRNIKRITLTWLSTLMLFGFANTTQAGLITYNYTTPEITYSDPSSPSNLLTGQLVGSVTFEQSLLDASGSGSVSAARRLELDFNTFTVILSDYDQFNSWSFGSSFISSYLYTQVLTSASPGDGFGINIRFDDYAVKYWNIYFYEVKELEGFRFSTEGSQITQTVKWRGGSRAGITVPSANSWTGGPAIAVPEASSLALFSLGIIGLAICRRQRTKHRSVKV